MNEKTYTIDEIKNQIATNNKWLERAILAIHARQTATEQIHFETIVHNGVGFNAVDAPYMTFVSNWLQKGNRLSGQHVEKSRKRMMKYAAQLTKIANGEL